MIGGTGKRVFSLLKDIGIDCGGGISFGGGVGGKREIDYFDDGGFSEWTVKQSATLEEEANKVKQGSTAARVNQNGDPDIAKSEPGDGLPNYPTVEDEIEFYMASSPQGFDTSVALRFYDPENIKFIDGPSLGGPISVQLALVRLEVKSEGLAADAVHLTNSREFGNKEGGSVGGGYFKLEPPYEGEYLRFNLSFSLFQYEFFPSPILIANLTVRRQGSKIGELSVPILEGSPANPTNKLGIQINCEQTVGDHYIDGIGIVE
jgi:hypothetical protein